MVFARIEEGILRWGDRRGDAAVGLGSVDVSERSSIRGRARLGVQARRGMEHGLMVGISFRWRILLSKCCAFGC